MGARWQMLPGSHLVELPTSAMCRPTGHTKTRVDTGRPAPAQKPTNLQVVDCWATEIIWSPIRHEIITESSCGGHFNSAFSGSLTAES